MSGATVSYYTFNPDHVAACLARGDWAGCWDYLTEMLKSFSSVFSPGTNILIQQDMEDKAQRKNLEDFGALLGELVYSLLGDADTKLPDKSFFALITYHEVLHNLFNLYGFGNTNSIVETILARSKKISDLDQKKILLLLSLWYSTDCVAILKRIDPRYRLPAYVSYISYNALYSRTVYDNKVKLYALRYDLERLSDFDMLRSAFLAYFNCSYLAIPDRHAIKININKAVQKFIQAYQSRPDYKRFVAANQGSGVAKNPSEKPRMVIVMELFSKGHAMTRSWGSWIAALQSEFDTVILTKKGTGQSDHQDIFGHVEYYNNLGEFLVLAKKYAPDVLMLPSVGMNFYGIVAANMRLAPVQIMGLGHPASTMSESIDFVYGPREMYHPEAFFKEIYIMDNSPYRFVPNLTKAEFFAITPFKRREGDTSPLRVAIVGMPLKISAPFIEFLVALERKADFDIHFSFHLGSVALDMLCLSRTLDDTFKNCSYTGYKTYRDYLAALAEAEIVLNPFPFGHTNTLIDTMLLGIPCVGLEGNEPSSKTESYILDILGLKDDFSAKSLEDYEQKFLALAQKIRSGEAPAIDRNAVYESLYGDSISTDFGRIIKWVYDHKDAMKASGKKAFVAEEPVKG